MPKRVLYLVAYDVCEPKRLRKIHKAVKRFATGGQKSVFECFLTPAERRRLLAETREIIAAEEDRLALLRIEERARPILHGIATPVVDPDFYLVD